jgi:hypothetical protein
VAAVSNLANSGTKQGSMKSYDLLKEDAKMSSRDYNVFQFQDEDNHSSGGLLNVQRQS